MWRFYALLQRDETMTSFFNRLVPAVCGLLLVSSLAFAQTRPASAAAPNQAAFSPEEKAASALPASAASTSASTKQGIVVWRLEAKTGVSEKDIDSLSGYITTEVERLSGHKVISEADIRTVLKGEELRQKCGAEATSCVVEIGAALGVPEAVSGDLGRLGSFWVLNLRRINIQTAAVIGRSSRNIEGSMDNLLRALPGAVAELFGVAAPSVALSRNEASQAVYPMNPYKKWGYISFFSGLGVAGLAGGLGTGMAKKEADSYNGAHTVKAAKDARSANKRWTGTAIAGYALGGALMVGGAVLWIVSPGDRAWAESHGVSTGLAPASGGLTLTLGGRW